MGIFENSKFKQKKQTEKQQKQQNIQRTETIKKPIETSKAIDPDLEFKMVNGLTDSVTNATLDTMNGIAPENMYSNGTNKEGVKKIYYPIKPYKRLVNKTLIIVLIENTAQVAKEKEKVLQIINTIVKSDLVCFMNYSDVVQESEIIDVTSNTILYDEGTGDRACLFDALVEVEKLVSSKYLVTEEKEKEKIFINNIEIIGIGTCIDNASKTSKEDALNSFLRVSSRQKVITKYYCLTDEYFIKAAEIGFHSIGSISRCYQ